MNTYVMSDIHGCYDEFQQMLEKIHFSDRDLLIAPEIILTGEQRIMK